MTGMVRGEATSIKLSRVSIRCLGDGPEEEEVRVERMPSKPFFMLEIRFLACEMDVEWACA
jgi:hypothetical protein